ncbi:MAG: hypothetical protein RJB26_505 [Pseudomonadota bacterium]
MNHRYLAAVAACLFTWGAMAPAQADEGMWTFDNPPRAQVKARYGVDLDDAWLQRVRLGAVRIDGGCSASLVSQEGLVLTNHHCVESCLTQHSTPATDLYANGFVSQRREEELKCAGATLSVLVAMDDVTAQVQAATSAVPAAEANAARKKALTQLEATCEATAAADPKIGPRKCETVRLYQGGQYWLYQYHRYTDVRLAFAPEIAAAQYGGDVDNFQFPRWCLDMSLLRVYENGAPAKTPNALRINFKGAPEGAPVFVVGHPGSTQRLLTVSDLDFLREVTLPGALFRNQELRGRYIQFSKLGGEQARITEEPLLSLENGIKVRRKQNDALLDERFMATKRAEEAKLRAAVAANAALAAELGDPWAMNAAANAAYRNLYLDYTHLEGGAAFGGSQLFGHARRLVRATAEREKPNDQRLREYTDTRLPAVAAAVAAASPIPLELERLRLVFGLERARELLGPDHPFIQQVLGRESPDALAARVLAGTTLADPAARKALYEGGSAAVAASTDPLIVLARSIDDASRTLRKRYEDEVEGPSAIAAEKIAKARFAVLGTGTYPDATFTLRLSYGAVQGWEEQGKPVVPFTRFGRAFERHTGEAPFALPKRWLDAKAQLDLDTPYDFSSTNDIIGGNSGSPVLNAKGEVIGLAFDGNIHSIAGAFGYDPVMNRTVSVHTAAMKEALGKVYGAKTLLAELERR